MITKKNFLTVFFLLTVIVVVIPSNIASASVFDWIFRNTADYQSPVFSFAGVDHEIGLNLIGGPASNEQTESVPWQFFNDSAIMALNMRLPDKKAGKFGQKIYHLVSTTAYSSTKDQTDNTPFITAMGTHVRDGVAAANFLPLGTIIKIPEIFGDKVFVVEDRMNKRYDYRLDLWFPTRAAAKEWGIRKVKIEIIS